MGRPEESFDPVVVDMDAQALADELGGGGIEDAVDEEAARLRDAGNHFSEIGGAACGQRPQLCHLGAHGSLAPAVAAGDEFVNKTAPAGKFAEVPGAAQDCPAPR
jgi:hypothetical protein